MSTINVQEITNGTDTITVDDSIKGSAKAWICFNGTNTITTRKQYNISSIRDDGTGLYTIFFANAMSDTNYVLVFGTVLSGTTSGGAIVAIAESNLGADRTTSSFRIRVKSSGGTNLDREYISIAVYGD